LSRIINIGGRELKSGFQGGLVAIVIPVLFWFGPPALSDWLERPANDLIATIWPPPATDAIVVVDIDSANLTQFEGRRLSRLRLAQLIEEITRLGASAIAVDLVLEAPCATSRPDVARLAQAIRGGPVTLGFLLSSKSTAQPPPRSPIAIGINVRLPNIWTAEGAETSCASLVNATRGLSAISLAGDFDARVRSAPAVIAVGNRSYPSLAVDAVRLSQKTGAVFLVGDPPVLRVGNIQARLDSSASVNLRFSTAKQQSDRTISAARILGSEVGPDRISGKIVFLGSSAAELGGLRPVPGNPLKPSVQIQADIATNLLLGSNPVAPDWARAVSTSIALVLGVALAFFVVLIRPSVAVIVTLLVLAGWVFLCAVSFHFANIMLDPLLPTLAIIAATTTSSAIQFSAVRKAETIIRQRFEQRLPASVVKKLVAKPDLLKLKGEQRVATSMFTDVEGFTTTTEKISPAELIGLLDRYFEGLTGIIVAHGGMVDKTIGDGMHALFNAPVDLEGHAEIALECAREILVFSENFKNSGLAAKSGFGRTRIGIESGNVVLGDVGAAGKVDYSAFGSTINIAARLQEANKQFGTSVLVGPGAQLLMTESRLADLGDLELRGIGAIRAYTITHP
jgi:adenylate cyclase